MVEQATYNKNKEILFDFISSIVVSDIPTDEEIRIRAKMTIDGILPLRSYFGTDLVDESSFSRDDWMQDCLVDSVTVKIAVSHIPIETERINFLVKKIVRMLWW